MRLLLDAHILLWWLGDESLLPNSVRRAISIPENEVFISAATIWEIEIKRAAGKLEAPDGLLEALKMNDFAVLSINGAHAIKAASLPPHHLDPFDRMLVAQAIMENLTLVSVDHKLKSYEVATLPVA
jgi:PIN domain nuclease of toxin-antitoxin system